MKRRVLLLMAVVQAIALHSLQARADEYPIKPIKLIVPFPPGGGVDTIARIVSQKL